MGGWRVPETEERAWPSVLVGCAGWRPPLPWKRCRGTDRAAAPARARAHPAQLGVGGKAGRSPQAGVQGWTRPEACQDHAGIEMARPFSELCCFGQQ